MHTRYVPTYLPPFSHDWTKNEGWLDTYYKSGSENFPLNRELVGDNWARERQPEPLRTPSYVYQMSLRRINCYHHSLWLSVNSVAKKNYLLLSPYCFSIDFCYGNLRVKLETTVCSIWPFQYDDVPQETLIPNSVPKVLWLVFPQWTWW